MPGPLAMIGAAAASPREPHSCHGCLRSRPLSPTGGVAGVPSRAGLEELVTTPTVGFFSGRSWRSARSPHVPPGARGTEPLARLSHPRFDPVPERYWRSRRARIPLWGAVGSVMPDCGQHGGPHLHSGAGALSFHSAFLGCRRVGCDTGLGPLCPPNHLLAGPSHGCAAQPWKA